VKFVNIWLRYEQEFEAQFLAIMYDSIVLCLQTSEVYLTLNIT